MFKIYPKYFNNRSKTFLKRLANNEGIISYEFLSYKICFSEENSNRFHVIDFLKKYGTLYDLLDNLLTSKITVNNENADEMTFITDPMDGYDKTDLFDEKAGVINRDKSWKNEALIKANNYFF